MSVTTRKRQEVAEPSPPEPATLLNIIAAAASNPNVDVEKLARLIELQRGVTADEAARAYAAAMNLVQAEIQPVVRDAENAHTRSLYAKLETIDRAIRPIYTKHGFSLSFSQVEPLTPGMIRLECTCTHAQGHSKTYHREAPPDITGPGGKANKTALHGMGSTDTFLRRYLACGVFNVVLRDGDDDGVAGSVAYITESEAVEIEKLLASTKASLAGFLEYMGADSVRAIFASDRTKAMQALLAKSRQLAKAQQGDAAP
jgi:hypothetical protein